MKITGTSNSWSSSLTASIPELMSAKPDVGEDEPGTLRLGERNGFGVRAGDADYLVSEAFHQTLQIDRDHRLVLDDQHVGRDLGGQLAPGFIDQLAQLLDIHVENGGSVLLVESLKRDEQERLTGKRRYLAQMPVRRSGSPARPQSVEVDGVPDSGEGLVQPGLRVGALSRIAGSSISACSVAAT